MIAEIEAFASALDDQIDSESSNLPVRSDSITLSGKTFHHLTLQGRLRLLLVVVFESAQQMAGIIGMFDQLPPQIAGFEILLGI